MIADDFAAINRAIRQREAQARYGGAAEAFRRAALEAGLSREDLNVLVGQTRSGPQSTESEPRIHFGFRNVEAANRFKIQAAKRFREARKGKRDYGPSLEGHE